MISVVIVTYNSAACVASCIASVRGALPDAELVVVDNASEDDTVRESRAAAPEVHLIECGENLGFGRACNKGAETASGTHVLFLNPDASVVAIDRERLDHLLAGRPFGLVAPLFDGAGDRRTQETSWTADFLAHTLAVLRPRELRSRPRRFRGGTAAIWVSGGMLLVARTEFLGQGGFDPRFFLYYEDRDLSRRYRIANLPIRATDAIRGRHITGSSSASDGLRAAPMAWSLLGWIQYVFLRDGERAGRRAARFALATLNVLRFAVHVLGTLRWPRAQRKALQLDQVLDFIGERASGDDNRFCPDALRFIRRLR
jgi:N-acetylglucosaminyl-diphospho-decaprenol L-rhamnosyltransferase